MLLFGVVLLMVASGVYQRVKSGSPDVEPFDIDAFKSVKVDDAKNADKVYRTAAPLFVSESSLRKTPEASRAFEQNREQAVEDQPGERRRPQLVDRQPQGDGRLEKGEPTRRLLG